MIQYRYEFTVGQSWSTSRSLPPLLPILGHTLLPLPFTSIIDHECKFFFVELLLNGYMITISGTGVRGRVDLAIWECPLTAVIYAHVFCNSARKFLYRQPYWHRPGWGVKDAAETGTHSSPLPSQPLSSLWTAVRSHCKVCSGAAALRLAILKYIKLSLQKREALFAADLVMQHPSLMSKSLGKIKRWGSCIVSRADSHSPKTTFSSDFWGSQQLTFFL